ncbi:MAG: TGS domain-containing protein [Candidatus Bathyarchaeia archaeon]
MPTNLTAEAKAKWKKYLSAKSNKEKLIALQEFLSSIPKHKGNEKLRSQIKKKISSLKLEIDEEKKKSKHSAYIYKFEKTAAAQVAIIGFTNVGKSSLLTSLTNAKPEISSYPYTTKSPIAGTMNFKDIQFQLIELPAPTIKDFNEAFWESKIFELIKSLDALIIMLDLTGDPLNEFKMILNMLNKAGISLEVPRSKVEINIEKCGVGIQTMVMGNLIDCTSEDLKKLFKDHGIKNARITLIGSIKLEDVEKAILERLKVFKPGLILANKIDLCELNELENSLMDLKNFIKNEIPVIPVSCKTKQGLNELGKFLFDILGIVRVYTKNPKSKELSMNPIIVKRGSTIGDVAKKIHSSFIEFFKYAKVWGKSAKFPGEKVGIEHSVEDGDIVEIHIN